MRWHRHRWVAYGRKGYYVLEECSRCGRQRWRDWTRALRCSPPLSREQLTTYIPYTRDPRPRRYDLATGEAYYVDSPTEEV